MLLLLASTAWSSRVDVARLKVLIADSARRVEQVTGLELDPVPTTVFATSREAEQMSREALVALLVAQEGLSPAEAAAVAIALVDIPESMIAYYGFDHRMYVLTDRMAAPFTFLPKDQLEPLFDCVLAHELTHAIQMRHLPLRQLDAEALAINDALYEGHAGLVEQTICTALGHDLITGFLHSGSEGIANRDPEGLVFEYGYTREYLRLLEEREGRGAAWTLLAEGDLPTRDEIVDTVRATQDSWTDDRVVRQLFAALGTEPTHTGVHEAIGTLHAVGGPGIAAVPNIRSSWAGARIEDEEAIGVFVLHFDDPTLPESLVKERRRLFKETRTVYFPGGDPMWPDVFNTAKFMWARPALRKAPKLPSVGIVLPIHKTRTESWWIAHDDVLVGVESRYTDVWGLRQLVRVLQTLD